MQLRFKPSFIAALAALMALPAAALPVQLTGVAIYDSSSTGDWTGGYWDTTDGNFAWNVYLFTGSTAAPTFLNSGDTSATLKPAVPFAHDGAYTIRFAAESQSASFLGMNLYFDNGMTTSISAFTGLDGPASAFSKTAAGVTTYGVNGPESSADSLVYSSGGVTITLTGLQYTHPSVDIVGSADTGGGSSNDTIGSFTLSVTGTGVPDPNPIPEPSTFVLAAAGFAAVAFRRFRA